MGEEIHPIGKDGAKRAAAPLPTSILDPRLGRGAWTVFPDHILPPGKMIEVLGDGRIVLVDSPSNKAASG